MRIFGSRYNLCKYNFSDGQSIDRIQFKQTGIVRGRVSMRELRIHQKQRSACEYWTHQQLINYVKNLSLPDSHLTQKLTSHHPLDREILKQTDIHSKFPTNYEPKGYNKVHYHFPPSLSTILSSTECNKSS